MDKHLGPRVCLGGKIAQDRVIAGDGSYAERDRIRLQDSGQFIRLETMAMRVMLRQAFQLWTGGGRDRIALGFSKISRVRVG